MTTMSVRTRMLVAVLAVLQVFCHQAILTAPQGSTMTLVVNPTFIPVNGGVSVVSALVVEPAGTVVPDGTVVQFFTDLGRIDEQGKTNDGVARVNLVADTRSGTANITAISGVANGTATVTIGNVLPDHINMRAEPTRIRSNDPRQSRIVATVLDAGGNTVQNVQVFFRVADSFTPSPTPTPTPAPAQDRVGVSGSAPSGTETMASNGAPVFTDANGEAVDFLQTRYPREAAPKVVTVVAETANGIEGSIEVQIN
jgi:hypothetical protein